MAADACRFPVAGGNDVPVRSPDEFLWLPTERAARTGGAILSVSPLRIIGRSPPTWRYSHTRGRSVHVPGEQSSVGFWTIIVVMAAVLITLVYYFRKRGFL